MHRVTLTIGWIRDLPRLRAAEQEETLVSSGLPRGDIVVDGRQIKGRSRETWAWLMKKWRAGDTLAVAQLRAIYNSKAGRTPRAALFATLHSLEDAGGTVIEVSTGRSTAIVRERDMMVSDCLDQIARSSRGGDAGRPKRELTPAERDLAMHHWLSLDHATNQAAVDAIRAAARKSKMRGLLRLRSPQAFTNVFGASGRAKLRRKSKNP